MPPIKVAQRSIKCYYYFIESYATEVSTKILEYGFDELGFDYLVASCDRPNIESHKLAERLGMKQVEERTIDGNPILFFRIDKLSY